MTDNKVSKHTGANEETKMKTKKVITSFYESRGKALKISKALNDKYKHRQIPQLEKTDMKNFVATISSNFALLYELIQTQFSLNDSLIEMLGSQHLYHLTDHRLIGYILPVLENVTNKTEHLNDVRDEVKQISISQKTLKETFGKRFDSLNQIVQEKKWELGEDRSNEADGVLHDIYG